MSVVSSSQQKGYADCQKLANQLIKDLFNNGNGMTLVYPSTIDNSVHKATLASNASTDPLYQAQRWCIQIDAATADTLQVVVGTDLQLPVDGTVAIDVDDTIPGLVGTYTGTTANVLIDRTGYLESEKPVILMDYVVTIASQGIACAIYEELVDPLATPVYGWFVVQRSVDNRTGVIRASGRAPVFCLYGMSRPKDSSTLSVVNKIIVRESDIIRPVSGIDATVDSTDSNRHINVQQQVAITENNNYVVYFPTNLNTQRYAYPQDDLDMIGFTSADVIAQSNTSSFKIYGEDNCRNYLALMSNGANNTNMRILILTT
jgi:hypothetical protein